MTDKLVCCCWGCCATGEKYQTVAESFAKNQMEIIGWESSKIMRGRRGEGRGRGRNNFWRGRAFRLSGAGWKTGWNRSKRGRGANNIEVFYAVFFWNTACFLYAKRSLLVRTCVHEGYNKRLSLLGELAYIYGDYQLLIHLRPSPAPLSIFVIPETKQNWL